MIITIRILLRKRQPSIIQRENSGKAQGFWSLITGCTPGRLACFKGTLPVGKVSAEVCQQFFISANVLSMPSKVRFLCSCHGILFKKRKTESQNQRFKASEIGPMHYHQVAIQKSDHMRACFTSLLLPQRGEQSWVNPNVDMSKRFLMKPCSQFLDGNLRYGRCRCPHKVVP